MNQATLENLHCVVTEDAFGADECRLEVYADGELRYAYRAEPNNDLDCCQSSQAKFAEGG
jgi:hypothetical protein